MAQFPPSEISSREIVPARNDPPTPSVSNLPNLYCTRVTFRPLPTLETSGSLSEDLRAGRFKRDA